MPLRIGALEMPDGAVLAPLASVTNAPFRHVCLEHGCSYAVTEMVACEAIVRDIRPHLRRMSRAANEKHLVVQLFGGTPSTMARAAAYACEQAAADMIDINMGCPVRKILGVGAGVALMRDPDRATAIVREVVHAVPQHVPITVKMRAGWDDGSVTAVELARRLEDAGAAALTIHGRTKEQVHRGASRYEVIAAVKQAVRVPVIGNGGVQSYLDARNMRMQTGCDAVMIGRGALGNPWLFRSIAEDRPYTPSVQERFDVIRKHLALDVEHVGDGKAAREMRKHLGWYLRGLPGSSLVRGRLQDMRTSADMLECLHEYAQALQSGTARHTAEDFPA